ncbi:MAG: hypothetical protein ACXV5L_07750 [Thermoanaerobaculia bacterium]
MPVLAAREGGGIPVQLPLFPTNNWWNTDISKAPAVADSTIYYPFMGGPNRTLHPDFGGDAGDGTIYGFPFLIVDGTQPLKAVTFVVSDESDGVNHTTDESEPFYPIPDEAATTYGWVEGGAPGNVDQRDDSDRHMLIVDKSSSKLFELYNVWFNGTNWEAFSGAGFDMNTNNRRQEGWTSADAAGLAILPGLVRYDEVYDSPAEINHAFRVTVQSTDSPFVFPASHQAGANTGALPMGARLRLKESKNISTFPAEMQKIFRAFKKYGLIVADNGSNMYISGTYDTRWDNGILNPAFGGLKVSDFEVIQFGWQPAKSLEVTLPRAVSTTGGAFSGTIKVTDKNYAVLTTYTGTVHFTSTDAAATLPANYTFTGGDGGSHTFTNAFTMPTPGDQTITATDISDPTVTATRMIRVGPRTPTGLVATAASPTTVSVTWDDTPGAVQYELQRRFSAAGFTTITTTAATSFLDTVAPNGIYVYQVRALDGLDSSPFSAPDTATTLVFTEDPLVPNVTRIKPVHLTEVRSAVNQFRELAGLPDAVFTDSTLNSTVRVRTYHLQEVQDALNEARDALLFVPNSYHALDYVAGDTFIQVNIQDIRNGLK